MFQYYLKIVPTLYSRTDHLFATNQFSVTRHSKGMYDSGFRYFNVRMKHIPNENP